MSDQDLMILLACALFMVSGVLALIAESKEGTFSEKCVSFGVSRGLSVNLLCGFTGLAGAASFWALMQLFN
ncbi:hypothetical protein DNH61_03960 [Paenibacillus sambharensis]|uniref:Uncharacterized protein n=1 Tax=Paenibacillus sambharensis TaxID=1803190 RepID=A0A2W1LA06_9BACL|nr:hypothetical protein [Paenibacillus sambharensis]PZD97058.1 hypothetical protein DNH61_03960 [Paenibacillus sambharensis]